MASKDSLRLLTVSDIQGNLRSFQELYDREINQQKSIDFIVHTGNFGFWDKETIENYRDVNYLKQIVAFSGVLEKGIVEELNNLSTISNTSNLVPADEFNYFKDKLMKSKHSISQLELYLNGTYELPCPVYTIFGPLDDPKIIDKFQSGEYKIPNLYIIDHLNSFEIKSPLPTQPNIKLYGLGGSLKIHSLFDSGNINNSSVSGKIGDLWITLIQIAEFYLNFTKQNNKDSINIFISHAPVIKTPLLEHLAIITNADFTISQGLHFRYPVMGNGMSFVDSMGGSAGYIENYRSKFSRLRMILGELWLIIKNDLLEILNVEENENLKKSIELGLSLFDKIPISINDSIDKIVPLTLNNEKEDLEANKKILKKINDYYFQAYYNLWHFNLCDHLSNNINEYNIMIFKLNKLGNFNLDYCNSQGFNFNFKLEDNDDDNDENLSFTEELKFKPKFNAIEYSPKTGIKKQVVLHHDENSDIKDGEHVSGENGEYNEKEEDVPNQYTEEEEDEEYEEYLKSKQIINSSRGHYRGGRGRGRGRGSQRSRGTYRGKLRGRGKN